MSFGVAVNSNFGSRDILGEKDGNHKLFINTYFFYSKVYILFKIAALRVFSAERERLRYCLSFPKKSGRVPKARARRETPSYN
jgi:hypothetical protein